MKKPLFLSFFFFYAIFLAGQDPIIHSVTLNDTLVEQYGKMEAVVDLTASFANPYNYDEIVVSALLTGPDGQQRTVDGFYMRDYDINPATGTLVPVGSQGKFKVRFSPGQLGAWTCAVSVTDANGSAAFPPVSFECTPSGNPNNKGFVRLSPTNYLQFDDGGQYIPVGENMAWQNGNPYLDYTNWLSKLHDNGGNFIRLWHAHWGLGIEWRSGSNGFEGLRRYKEPNCRYQDWLFDYCAENGVYIMVCLQHHGQVSSQVNPNWSDSPYNAVNGGPCPNTWDFFTNAQAIGHTKNRLRYVMARWGYARSVLVWELFNEVEWTDNFTSHQTEVADWHAEMAAYMKANDAHEHLVTTSYAQDQYDGAVWSNPDIDFTQTHFYINSPNLERALVSGIHHYLDDYDKPTLTGEFGLGGSSSLSNTDPDGIYIHNALWATLFGGGMGSGMTWWWDNYIHPRDLYYHFAPVSLVAAQIPFLNENMKPATSKVSGAPGDLRLTPNLGWGGIGDADITIDADGVLTPASPNLGVFLYGSEWNTQFRSPPNFSVFYPEAAEFTVKTGPDLATNPKIAIYRDGFLVLEQAAEVNKTYTIPVPAGQHLIVVDNTGTDWVTIASYTFGGLGSQIDSYTLLSENENVAAGWVLNNEYNHQYVVENGEPGPATGGLLTLEGFQDGEYAVFWYHCLSGINIYSEEVSAVGGKLTVPIPTLHWDLAFLVNSDPVSAREVGANLNFSVYPNPARPGSLVHIRMTKTIVPDRVALLATTGRPIQVLSVADGEGLHIDLPPDLPAGLYWISVEAGNSLGTFPIMVVK